MSNLSSTAAERVRVGISALKLQGETGSPEKTCCRSEGLTYALLCYSDGCSSIDWLSNYSSFHVDEEAAANY